MPETIRFYDEDFAIADRIGLMPLMRFAHVAKETDVRSLAALAVMYDLLEQCIADEDWNRFQDHATKHRADQDALLNVVTDAVGILSARPTSRPSDSSDGPPATAQSSTDDSSSQVIAHFEQNGRPDLALMVVKTQEAMTG